MEEDSGRPVVYRGKCCTVVYAVCEDGSSPARDFVTSLLLKDRTKIANLFARLGDLGEIRNREKFKLLEGVFFEFKSHQIRIPCYRAGNEWVLTHGFIKKKNEVRRAEITRAENIRLEDVGRFDRRRRERRDDR